MSEFYVQPPTCGTPKAWADWQKAESKAAAVAKRKATMAETHVDMHDAAVFSGRSLVWEGGDLASGVPGIATVAMEAGQDRELTFAQMEAKRNKRGKAKLSRTQRRRLAYVQARKGR